MYIYILIILITILIYVFITKNNFKNKFTIEDDSIDIKQLTNNENIIFNKKLNIVNNFLSNYFNNNKVDENVNIISNNILIKNNYSNQNIHNKGIISIIRIRKDINNIFNKKDFWWIGNGLNVPLGWVVCDGREYIFYNDGTPDNFNHYWIVTKNGKTTTIKNNQGTIHTLTENDDGTSCTNPNGSPDCNFFKKVMEEKRSVKTPNLINKSIFGYKISVNDDGIISDQGVNLHDVKNTGDINYSDKPMYLNFQNGYKDKNTENKDLNEITFTDKHIPDHNHDLVLYKLNSEYRLKDKQNKNDSIEVIAITTSRFNESANINDSIYNHTFGNDGNNMPFDTKPPLTGVIYIMPLVEYGDK